MVRFKQSLCQSLKHFYADYIGIEIGNALMDHIPENLVPFHCARMCVEYSKCLLEFLDSPKKNSFFTRVLNGYGTEPPQLFPRYRTQKREVDTNSPLDIRSFGIQFE